MISASFTLRNKNIITRFLPKDVGIKWESAATYSFCGSCVERMLLESWTCYRHGAIMRTETIFFLSGFARSVAKFCLNKLLLYNKMLYEINRDWAIAAQSNRGQETIGANTLRANQIMDKRQWGLELWGQNIWIFI